jgi:hypothetical protein
MYTKDYLLLLLQTFWCSLPELDTSGNSRMNSPAQLERYSIYLTRIHHNLISSKMQTMSQKQTKSLISSAIAKSMAPKVTFPQVVVAKKKKNGKNGTQSAANRFPSGQTSYSNRSTRNVQVFDEYVAEVSGSVAFAVTSYPFNPGQVLTFPRFSREAVLFEKWKCVSAEVYYKPQVSAFATNGQAGKVMLSFDYDPSDVPPATKQQVEDSDPHADCMPYEVCRLRLDPRLLNGGRDGKYVRPGGLPGSASIHDFDGGIINVSTVGNTNATNIGELRILSSWVLEKPILEAATSVPSNFHVSYLRSTADESLTTTVAFTLKLATTVSNGLGVTNTAGVITLPAGNYVVHAVARTRSTTASVTSIINTLLVDGVALGQILDYNSNGATNGGATNSGTWFVSSTGTTTIALTNTTTSGGTLTTYGSLVIESV